MSFGNSLSGYGVRLCYLVAAIFAVLKLFGVVQWSWWWVASPLLGALVIAVGVGLVITVIDLIDSARG